MYYHGPVPIQNITDYVGAIAESTEQQWDYEIPEQNDIVKTISVSLDGTCILMKNEGYREAMTGNLVLYNAAGERLHTIYIGATPEYGKESFLARLQNEVDKIKEKYPKARYVGIADGAASNWAFLEAKESRPAELPRQPLAELYMNVSAHTAPIKQTLQPSQSYSVQTAAALSLLYSLTRHQLAFSLLTF